MESLIAKDQFDIIRLSDKEAGAALRKKFGGMVQVIRHYVTISARTHLLGYKPSYWTAFTVEGLPVVSVGESYNLVWQHSQLIYESPALITGSVMMACAVEKALDVFIGELGCDTFGELVLLRDDYLWRAHEMADAVSTPDLVTLLYEVMG